MRFKEYFAEYERCVDIYLYLRGWSYCVMDAVMLLWIIANAPDVEWRPWILASDSSRVITWPGCWPLIRPEWSRDQDTGLWLADVEETRTQVGIFLENIDIVELIQLGDLLVQAYFAHSLMHPQNNGVWLIMIDHVTWTLASDWLRVITWPEYWPLIG